MGGPLPGHRPRDEAQRLLAPPMQGDLPVRPHRHQAHRRYGPRDADVGLRLPAWRRRLAGIDEIHRRAIRPPADRDNPQDHLRERRQVLRADRVERISAEIEHARPYALTPEAWRDFGA